jgi:hypothetical protein
MFAPLLEPGPARDGYVLLRDTQGLFRRFALRVGMFMSDIPEINRQLGTTNCPAHLPVSARYLCLPLYVCQISIRVSARYLCLPLAGILDSAITAFPCYACLCPKDMLGDVATRHPLRSTALVVYHVNKMRSILEIAGVTAMRKYRKRCPCRHHIDIRQISGRYS